MLSKKLEPFANKLLKNIQKDCKKLSPDEVLLILEYLKIDISLSTVQALANQEK